MKIYQKSCNSKTELAEFINKSGIKKSDIASLFQESDGLYTVMYYAE